MQIRDRIKEFKRVPASQLLPSPRNWRTHPKSQQDALRGVLAEIGFADVILTRETKDGLEIIDGHLRADVMGQEQVPVVVLDVTRDEADKLLVTIDPLAAMAHADHERLFPLLESVAFESDSVNAMLEALANGERDVMPNFEPVGIDEQGRLDEKAKVICPECGYEFTP